MCWVGSTGILPILVVVVGVVGIVVVGVVVVVVLSSRMIAVVVVVRLVQSNSVVDRKRNSICIAGTTSIRGDTIDN